MTNSVNTTSPQEGQEANPVGPASVQQQISKLLKEVTTPEGKLNFPPDVDPVLREAVTAHKRHRDTQRSYHENTKQAKELAAENEVLKKEIDALHSQVSVPDEIEELKHSDPDKWLHLKNEKVAEHKRQSQEALERALAESKVKAQRQLLQEKLEEYNQKTQNPLSMDQFINSTPPAWAAKFENSDWSAGELVDQVVNFVYGSKAVDSGNPVPNIPDLGGAGNSMDVTSISNVEKTWEAAVI